jgi:hypothetical protein
VRSADCKGKSKDERTEEKPNEDRLFCCCLQNDIDEHINEEGNTYDLMATHLKEPYQADSNRGRVCWKNKNRQ